jgi:hypothetical protein
VREPLHRDRVAIVDRPLYGLGEGDDLRHNPPR